ncbi:MAG: glycerophosphodiester phosphodiesterase [Acidimicrobiia bacterium]|nr:glycerophosphodiester phosphodiesterase [Actinomycetota bacterium]MBL6923760.1 glycerophosphodiester phosphodiesterase [Acidimicrobiia bacterium]MBL6927000.1 glycerophosphodiester phosphodiesterase [Acidimicrobiia bacterium]
MARSDERRLHPFLDHSGVLAFAHRGGTGDWPENTMAAFGHAVSLGYSYLETDVHLTSDGVVVAFHDDSLDRVTDRQGLISELSWKEVSEARVGGTEAVPRLVDLLGAFPDAKINIDPKDDPVVGPLASLLLDHDALDRVCIGAFSDRRLDRCRKLMGAGLCTSAGPRATARFRLANFGLPFPMPPWRCLQVPIRSSGIRVVDERFVRHAHRLGLQVHVWTVDDPVEMGHLLDLGVDGIMTDVPAVLRAVLVEREMWA